MHLPSSLSTIVRCCAGYESSRNSEHGKRAAEAYDQQIRLYTMQHAILPALQKPSKLLEDAIR